MAYWLMKSEPDVFSIDDLARAKKTAWEGVRNYQARNFMRDAMRLGDLVLFYHSSADPSGAAGVAKVASRAYADPTQFDRKSEYFDPKSTPDDPTWMLVDVSFVEKFAEVLPLAVLKKSKKLENMPLLKPGQRLSVQPVAEAEFREVLRLAGAKTKL